MAKRKVRIAASGDQRIRVEPQPRIRGAGCFCCSSQKDVHALAFTHIEDEKRSSSNVIHLCPVCLSRLVALSSLRVASIFERKGTL
jgi:hypothetical protein